MKKVLFAMAIVSMMGFVACKSNNQKAEEPVQEAMESVENAASECCNKGEEAIEGAVEEVVNAADEAAQQLAEEIAK